MDDLVVVDASGNINLIFCDGKPNVPAKAAVLPLTSSIFWLSSPARLPAAVGRTPAEGTTGRKSFGADALQHLCTNLVDLAVLAEVEVTLPLLRDILNSAPMSLAQPKTPAWEAESDCATILRGADETTARNADPEARADFEECKKLLDEGISRSVGKDPKHHCAHALNAGASACNAPAA